MKSILIAGAGPSGLMAALAALAEGYTDITLYDPAPKRPDGRSAGVFYLHDHCDIPNIPYAKLHTYGEGTAQEYARKLYGDPNIRTSFPTEPRHGLVYDGMYAMDWLWKLFESHIVPVKVSGAYQLIRATQAFDRVVNTVPLDVFYGNALCPCVYSYIATAPTWDTSAYVEYHGDPANPLYRASAVFGREALEFIPGFYPRHELTNDWNIHRVKKVLPMKMPLQYGHDRLLYAGRYGAWDKKTLTHDVYRKVREWLRG